MPSELPAKRLLLIPSSLGSAGLEVLVPGEGGSAQEAQEKSH